MRLGRDTAESHARLIYGGASVGLISGEMIGIIPQFLRTRKIELGTLTELVTAPVTHERKDRIHALADAFVVLPGSLGV